jgi:hypothetical protein
MTQQDAPHARAPRVVSEPPRAPFIGAQGAGNPQPQEVTSVTSSAAPAPCPLCGSYSGTTLADSVSILLAVCDVLVVKALEKVGKMIVRSRGDRGRWQALNTRGLPLHQAHTLWPPQQADIERGLHGAWDVVPALLQQHGCCGVTARQVLGMLDSYASDLLITGQTHTLRELRYRFRSNLGLELGEPEQPYEPQAVPPTMLVVPKPSPPMAREG